jgi:guanine nucleotide-binding protein G(I)/G(S)/G(T) subunit beta-1
MSADMNSEQMQAKITAARREAEGLKDKIKRKKDDLADTSRKSLALHLLVPLLMLALQSDR